MSLEIIKQIESKVKKDNNGIILSNDIALRDGISTEWFRDQLRISLGEYGRTLTLEKQSSLAIGMVNSNEQLTKADPITIFGSILQISNLGLSLDGFRGEAYIVPFWNSRKNRLEAKPMLGYRGLKKKLIESGDVKKIDTNIYREKDDFIIRYGDDETISHTPKDCTSPIKGAYAILWLKNSSRQYDRMFYDEIIEIRDRSKSAFDKNGNLTGPWKSDFVEMAKKTVLRRLAKWASVSPDAQRAAVMEEYADNANTSFRVLDGGTIDYRVEEEKPIEVQQPKRIEVQEQKPEQKVEEKAHTVMPEADATEALKDIFNDNQKTERQVEIKTEEKKTKTISAGQGNRLLAIMNRAKKRTEDDLKTEILAPLGITSIKDISNIPLDIYNRVVEWAEGKEF